MDRRQPRDEQIRDIRDFQFEQRVRRITRPRSGLTTALLRRIGWEHGIMPDIESVVAEYADLFPHDLGNLDVDLEQSRPHFLVIEGDE